MNVATSRTAAGSNGEPVNSPHYFLNRALEPIRAFLEDPTVIEIAINRPGKVYVERLGADFMAPYHVAALTADEIQNIGERVAGVTNQFVSRANPLLSAALPTGERIQCL